MPRGEPDFSSLSPEFEDLPFRLKEALLANNLHTLDALANLTPEELTSIPGGRGVFAVEAPRNSEEEKGADRSNEKGRLLKTLVG